MVSVLPVREIDVRRALTACYRTSDSALSRRQRRFEYRTGRHPRTKLGTIPAWIMGENHLSVGDAHLVRIGKHCQRPLHLGVRHGRRHTPHSLRTTASISIKQHLNATPQAFNLATRAARSTYFDTERDDRREVAKHEKKRSSISRQSANRFPSLEALATLLASCRSHCISSALMSRSSLLATVLLDMLLATFAIVQG